MASPGHRSNMLSPRYTHVGIAAVSAGKELAFTLIFARRVKRFGVGARTHTDEHGSRLAVLMVLEGVPCK